MEKISYEAAICFQSDLKILEVGKLLSNTLFAGVQFGGLDECIHEEIPAIYIYDAIMGLQIILDEGQDGYCLSIGFDPVASSQMQFEEMNICAFFNRGFEQYIKIILMGIPELQVK